MKSVRFLILVSISTAPAIARADFCYWQPSRLMGEFAAGSLEAAGAGTAAIGIGAKAAGFYTISHATTSATMLGSTAGGASGAGTVGIMGGTGGAIGTIASIVLSPVVIGTSATVVIGGGATEIYCRESTEQTVGLELYDILKSAADSSDIDEILLTKYQDDYFFCVGPLDQEGSCHIFSRLYFTNGKVMQSMPWSDDEIVLDVN